MENQQDINFARDTQESIKLRSMIGKRLGIIISWEILGKMPSKERNEKTKKTVKFLQDSFKISLEELQKVVALDDENLEIWRNGRW